MSKKMFEDLVQKAKKLQEEIGKIQEVSKKKTVEASAGGGMVTVIANGAMEIVSIRIEPEVVSPQDIEMLQDLIVAAVNEALRRANEMVAQDMSKLTGGLRLPNLGGLFTQ